LLKSLEIYLLYLRLRARRKKVAFDEQSRKPYIYAHTIESCHNKQAFPIWHINSHKKIYPILIPLGLTQSLSTITISITTTNSIMNCTNKDPSSSRTTIRPSSNVNGGNSRRSPVTERPEQQEQDLGRRPWRSSAPSGLSLYEALNASPPSTDIFGPLPHLAYPRNSHTTMADRAGGANGTLVPSQYHHRHHRRLAAATSRSREESLAQLIEIIDAAIDIVEEGTLGVDDGRNSIKSGRIGPPQQ
jgi:hypothetical protein